MQAITTKYAGPTNTRGSRIIATAAAGKVIFGYDYSLNLDDNHSAAAEALRVKLGWTGAHYGDIVSGCNDKGDYVHVMTRAIGALRAITGAVVRNDMDDTNPYTRPVVKDALHVLANHDNVCDYLNVKL